MQGQSSGKLISVSKTNLFDKAEINFQRTLKITAQNVPQTVGARLWNNCVEITKYNKQIYYPILVQLWFVLQLHGKVSMADLSVKIKFLLSIS